MSDRFDGVIDIIDAVIQSGKREFIIYPFGERGAMVKGILNGIFGIQELAIADNVLSEKYDNIISAKDLSELLVFHAGAVVLVSHDNIVTYDVVRDELYKYVDKNRCVDTIKCLPQNRPAEETMHRKQAALDKKDQIGFDEQIGIYRPVHTHSRFYLPLYKTDIIQNEIFLHDDYYSLDQLTKVFYKFQDGIVGRNAKDKLFIDVGANIGNHTLFFANELQAGKIHCFEPVAPTFNILQKNIEINELQGRVCLHNCGLGKSLSKASVLSYSTSNIGGTGLWMDNDGDIEIKSMDEFSFHDVYFIKIDVEDMELAVLQGAKQTISRCHPYILVEAWYEKIHPIREYMSSLGYVDSRITDIDYLFYVK